MSDGPQDGEESSVWDRLRRRKVVQWGLAYAAGAWGLLQGLQFLVEAFEWPSSVLRLATVLFALGLPVALVLAWYHGDRGQQRVSRIELAIVTLLFLIGGGLFWHYHRTSATQEPQVTASSAPPSSSAPAALPADRSIAVLPFVNMSPDPEQAYFADGISEELLNLLAKVPELRVIARTSSFAFKGKDVGIAEIAQKLGVSHVLEGSVRRSGDTLRITAQLIRTADSSHLWSETYDRQMTDVFKVQDEIASAVVSELKVRLLGAALKLPETDPKAYALFLRARETARRYDKEAFVQAMELYRQALAIDPTYAPAWDGVADGYYNLADLGMVSGEEAIPGASEAIGSALASDPSYAPALARAALIDGALKRDLASAAQHLERGLALDPANLDLAGVAIKIARRLGRVDLPIKFAAYLVARDPLNAYGYEQLALSYRDAGQLDEAAAVCRIALEVRPGSVAIRGLLGDALILSGKTEAALVEYQQEPIESYRLTGLSVAYHALGRDAESDTALAELVAKHGGTAAYYIASVLAYRGEPDRAFEWLEKAVEARDPSLGSMTIDPWFERIHDDPRWLPFLRKHGMAPEQLAAIKFDVKLPE